MIIWLKIRERFDIEPKVDCGHFRSGEEYFERWARWYRQLDESALPGSEVKKKAQKKSLSVPDAFAGMLAADFGVKLFQLSF